MSDLFGTQSGAKAYSQDLINGLTNYTNDIAAGNQQLANYYGLALQPYTQNNATAQQGVTALGNALGLNGQAGSQQALTQLQSTPGYQFQLQQGNNAINAAAAANGTLNSGNQLTALANYNQGLAGTTYNNYVSQLQPYLGYSQNSTAGIGNIYTGLGSGLNQNYNNLGNATMTAASAMGQAQQQADNAQSQDMFGLIGGVAKLGAGLLGGLL